MLVLYIVCIPTVLCQKQKMEMWFMWCNLGGGESQFILDLVYDININLQPKVYIWFNLSISSVYFIVIIFVSVWLLTIFRLFTTLRSLQLSSLHEEP